MLNLGAAQAQVSAGFRFEAYDSLGSKEAAIVEAEKGLKTSFPIGSDVAPLLAFLNSKEVHAGGYCVKRTEPHLLNHYYCQYSHIWSQDNSGTAIVSWVIDIEIEPQSNQILNTRVFAGAP
jgi:hypothetical protein